MRRRGLRFIWPPLDSGPPRPIETGGAPILAAIPNQSATVGQPFSLDLAAYASDPDGGSLTYTATGLPAGLALSGSVISGTPTTEANATVNVTVTDPGGLSASGSFGLSVTAAQPAAIDSIVIAGASLMNSIYGQDLTTPNAEATTELANLGVSLPVYGYANGGVRINVARQYYNAIRAAHPNALIVMHLGGNDVTATRPYDAILPADKATIETGMANLVSVAANDPRFYYMSISFRDYGDTTFQNPDQGAKPYNENMFIPWIALNWPHAIGAGGRPKLDFYRRTLQSFETWLQTDNIHLTPTPGQPEVRTWMLQRIADILANNPIAEIAERVYVPPAGVAPTITKAAIVGTSDPTGTLTADIAATGSTPMTITQQWRKNGTNIAGATGATLDKATVAVGDEIDFTYTASNGTPPDATGASTNKVTITAPSALPTLTLQTGTAAYLDRAGFGKASDHTTFWAAGRSGPLLPEGQIWGMEFWGKHPTATKASNVAVGEGNDRGFFVIRNGGNSPLGQICFTFRGAAGVTSHMTGGPRVDDDLWHHFAVQFHAAGTRLFVDGALVATPSAKVTATQGAGPFVLGTFATYSNTMNWTGQIDEVLVWTGERYTAAFTPPAAPYATPPAGTVAHFPLNGTLGAT